MGLIPRAYRRRTE